MLDSDEFDLESELFDEFYNGDDSFSPAPSTHRLSDLDSGDSVSESNANSDSSCDGISTDGEGNDNNNNDNINNSNLKVSLDLDDELDSDVEDVVHALPIAPRASGPVLREGMSSDARLMAMRKFSEDRAIAEARATNRVRQAIADQVVADELAHEIMQSRLDERLSKAGHDTPKPSQGASVKGWITLFEAFGANQAREVSEPAFIADARFSQFLERWLAAAKSNSHATTLESPRNNMIIMGGGSSVLQIDAEEFVAIVQQYILLVLEGSALSPNVRRWILQVPENYDTALGKGVHHHALGRTCEAFKKVYAGLFKYESKIDLQTVAGTNMNSSDIRTWASSAVFGAASAAAAVVASFGGTAATKTRKRSAKRLTHMSNDNSEDCVADISAPGAEPFAEQSADTDSSSDSSVKDMRFRSDDDSDYDVAVGASAILDMALDGNEEEEGVSVNKKAIREDYVLDLDVVADVLARLIDQVVDGVTEVGGAESDVVSAEVTFDNQVQESVTSALTSDINNLSSIQGHVSGNVMLMPAHIVKFNYTQEEDGDLGLEPNCVALALDLTAATDISNEQYGEHYVTTNDSEGRRKLCIDAKCDRVELDVSRDDQSSEEGWASSHGNSDGSEILIGEEETDIEEEEEEEEEEEHHHHDRNELVQDLHNFCNLVFAFVIWRFPLLHEIKIDATTDSSNVTESAMSTNTKTNTRQNTRDIFHGIFSLNDSIAAVVEDVMFSTANCRLVMGHLHACNAQRDEQIAVQAKNLSELEPSVLMEKLGLNADLIKAVTPSGELARELPFYPVVQLLQHAWKHARTPHDKIKYIVAAMRRVHTLVGEGTARQQDSAILVNGRKKSVMAVGADDLLPIFIFSTVHSGPRDLESQCCLMDIFLGNSANMGEWGYALTLVQTASAVIPTLSC